MSAERSQRGLAFQIYIAFLGLLTSFGCNCVGGSFFFPQFAITQLSCARCCWNLRHFLSRSRLWEPTWMIVCFSSCGACCWLFLFLGCFDKVRNPEPGRSFLAVRFSSTVRYEEERWGLEARPRGLRWCFGVQEEEEAGRKGFELGSVCGCQQDQTRCNCLPNSYVYFNSFVS